MTTQPPPPPPSPPSSPSDTRPTSGGPSASSAKTVLIVIGVVGVLGLLLVATCMVSILVPALGKAREAAVRIKGATQLRQIGQGLTIYAAGNGDRYPGAGEDWGQILVSNGLITADLLTAPQAQAGQVSYYYVPGLVSDFETRQVLIFENPDLYDGQSANVCFEDGHTEWLQGPALWSVLDAITLEDGTPYRPHRAQP